MLSLFRRKKAHRLTQEELEKLSPEEQKVIALNYGFKLVYKNYAEFWKEDPHAFKRESLVFSERKNAKRIHAMLKGSCCSRHSVALCYEQKQNGELIFLGLHPPYRCPDRKYKYEETFFRKKLVPVSIEEY